MLRGASFLLPLVLVAGLVLAVSGCGSEEPAEQAAPAAPAAAAPKAPAPQASRPAPPPAPDSLPSALVLSLASFAPSERGKPPTILPARMEFLVRKDGKWSVTSIEDPESDVFHKAMHYVMPDGSERILSAAGTAAALKLWQKDPDGHSATTVWEKDFGGKFSRMRDVEVADLFGDGANTLAVATHDQGIVATVHPQPDGSFSVKEIDAEPDTFVHEIEIGDLNGDGTLEVYATPSEPNRLDGSVQTGQVVRYVPAKGEGRTVVADLKDRHAKEILVADVDQNGRDELYVVVEGRVNKQTKSLDERVEIRRYEADTDPAQGVVIAEIEDHLCRFLTVGDIEGDGDLEVVAAAFGSGLWLLRPGPDPMKPWSVSSIDRNSGGFEHAASFADLDGDGKDELYVASDKHKEVRRYVLVGDELVPETIFARGSGGGGIFTWNIMPVPLGLVP